jgi:hypothetical protein
VVLDVDAPVVSDHEDIALLHPPGREIPIPPGLHMNLFYPLAVYIEVPVSEFDFLPLQGHDPLEKHNPGPGKPDVHHLEALRFGKEVAQPPTEIKIAAPVGGFHAAPLNPEGKTNVSEKQEGAKGRQTEPDEEPGF